MKNLNKPPQRYLTHCILETPKLFAPWEFFPRFFVVRWFFSKSTLKKKFFQEYHQSVKQFGSRSSLTFCQAWSGSKLFAKVYQLTTLGGKELAGTLADSEDPDEMQHNAAFHRGLRCLLRLKQPSGTEIHNNSELSSCDPLKYTMGSPILIVSIWMGKSIRIRRVKNFLVGTFKPP